MYACVFAASGDQALKTFYKERFMEIYDSLF